MSIVTFLLPLLIPMLTELVKTGIKALVGKMPPAAVPLLATALGAASSAIPGSPVPDATTGALIGAAGVAVHQVFTMNPPANAGTPQE